MSPDLERELRQQHEDFIRHKGYNEPHNRKAGAARGKRELANRKKRRSFRAAARSWVG